MNTTITGKVICAGRLKDNNGDEFHGLMIETGIDELMNRAVPLYQDVQVIKDGGNYVVIGDEKRQLIDLIIKENLDANQCGFIKDVIETFEL
jgi:hypothetical protein